MSLAQYRSRPLEQMRTDDLLALIPGGGARALDIGARDGHFSALLAARYEKVLALDLKEPAFRLRGVECVAGDVTHLAFQDGAFDLVFCAEVLEHVPAHRLQSACRELARVTRDFLVVGVPFRQDLRVARTRCEQCGTRNPPWGHVNSFDVDRLRALFPRMSVVRTSFVGGHVEVTNVLSSALMDFAGNPFGTYAQHEPCIQCGKPVGRPAPRNPMQRAATRVASVMDVVQRRFSRVRPNWVHVLFRKR